jgi:hypothetical protein
LGTPETDLGAAETEETGPATEGAGIAGFAAGTAGLGATLEAGPGADAGATGLGAAETGGAMTGAAGAGAPGGLGAPGTIGLGAVPGTATLGGIEAGPEAETTGFGRDPIEMALVSGADIFNLGAAGDEDAAGFGEGRGGIAFKGIASVIALGTGAETTGFGGMTGAAGAPGT